MVIPLLANQELMPVLVDRSAYLDVAIEQLRLVIISVFYVGMEASTLHPCKASKSTS